MCPGVILGREGGERRGTVRFRGRWIEGTNNERNIEAEHRVSRGKKHMLKKDEARNSKQADIMLDETRPTRGT
jgi:hypothetical protein